MSDNEVLQPPSRSTAITSVAHRLLGSATAAEDAVQDTWLRLAGADTSKVENLGGWLTTVVARIALNMLRSRRYRQEVPVGDPGRAQPRWQPALRRRPAQLLQAWPAPRSARRGSAR